MRSLLVALALVVCSAGAFAQTSTPASVAVPAATPNPGASMAPADSPPDPARARIDQIVGGGTSDRAWFAASVLAVISTAQIDTIVAQIKSSLGAYHGADRKAPGVYIARFDKGTDEVDIHFDDQQKIDGLLFKPPAMTSASLEEALQRLGAVPNISYVLLEGKTQRGGLKPDLPLGVGSAFKLAVLSALDDEVSAHKHRWDEVIRLDPKRRSFPSGVLQAWPANAPITLATAATEMISISDNTAADTLRALVEGPDLDRYALRNRPFLSTKALFVMKANDGAELLKRWQSAPSAAARAALLREAESRPLPALGDYPAAPRALEVEWLYSARELCGLISHVAHLPLMSVNPGVADRSAFKSVAFKGGSEPGVLNLTTQVTTKRGATYCLSVTVNDPAKTIEETSIETTYGGVLSALATH